MLEIDGDRKRTMRSVKALVRAARELGAKWRHWHVGSKVYAQPARRGRRRRAPR